MLVKVVKINNLFYVKVYNGQGGEPFYLSSFGETDYGESIFGDTSYRIQADAEKAAKTYYDEHVETTVWEYKG